MCTVSYIPPRSDRGFILTSNRDERVHRDTIAPRVYNIGRVQLCYPKDAVAGGSWIAASDNGRLACLLNGGFAPHEKQTHHTHSRGRVLVDLVASLQTPMIFFSYYDLSRTEPFTVVTIDLKDGEISEFSEFTWDGSKKYLKNLDPKRPYLWSSVTLYSETDRNLRQHWFKQFLIEQGMGISPEQVFSFHSGRHTPDERVNLIMRRDDELKTVSITQVSPDKGSLAMKYLDLVERSEHLKKI
ncbi:MAG: NRDE family protein [Bacteroidales bacterium]|nr:NRDE family protein [Bacteroidales bacterium]